MRARSVVSLILCIPIAGCMGTTPPASPTKQAEAMSAAPTRSLPVAGALPSATHSTPSPREPAVPTPAASPIWSKGERAILDGIRDDVRVRCTPSVEDLPPGTVAAVECRPGTTAVSRVGFYLFATPGDALDVYLNRVRAERVALGVDTGSGWEGATHCDGDIEPAAYAADDTLHCQHREAFFLNSDGYANYRVVRGNLYIGALGTNSRMEELRDWAWAGSEGEGVAAEGDLGMVPSFQTVWCGGASPRDTGALCAQPR
jgi:hypothetical protein